MAAQQGFIGQAAPGLARRQHIGQRRHIGQTQVQALAGQRMHQVGGVTHQHPARAAQALRPAQRQRPGGALTGQCKRAGRAAGGLGQRRLKFSRRRGAQGRRPLGRHRPHQAIAAAGLRPVKGQQGQHIGAAKPLPRQAGVRHIGHQAGGQRAVAIGAQVEGHAQCRPVGRGPALGQHGQRGRGGVGGVRSIRLSVGQQVQVRRKAGCRVQRRLQRRRIDDPGQCLGAGAPGREIQRTGRGVALDVHVVHRRHRIGGQGIPDLQAGQQST